MLELYKKRMNYNKTGRYDYGSAIREQNNEIFESIFEQDSAYIKCRINGEDVEARFYYGSSGDVNKDEPRFNLQFRSGIHYRIGTIVSIEEEEYDESEYEYWEREDIDDRPCYIEDGIHYRRWLIVNKTKELQFRKYYILPCDWCLKWIYNGKLYKQVGVMRIRSSYSSGIYQQYQLTTMEAQDGIWLPMNENTANLGMDQRVMIGDYVSLNPQSYKVTDYYSNHPIGILKLTLYRVETDPSDDKINLIANGIGFEEPVEEPVPTGTELNISYDIPITTGRTTTFSACYYVNGAETDIASLGYPIKWYIHHASDEKAYKLVDDNVFIVGNDDGSICKIKCNDNPNLINRKVTVTLWIDDGTDNLTVKEDYEIE